MEWKADGFYLPLIRSLISDDGSFADELKLIPTKVSSLQDWLVLATLIGMT